MSLRRGMSKLKESKEAMDRTGGGGGLMNFRIKDGESAVVRFFGDFEGEKDPIVAKRHYVKRLENTPGQSAYNWCGGNNDADCVYCYLRDVKKDKGISASDTALFFLYDKRKVHRFEDKQRVVKEGVRIRPGKQLKATDYYETKWPPCVAGKRPCPFCKQGNEAISRGWRYWALSVSFADQVVALQDTIRDYCKCGARDEEGGGTLQVSGYQCSNCGEDVEYQPELGLPVAACGSCGQTLPPVEEIFCTACDEPTRTDLQDWWIRVSRSGGGTDTTYNFEPIPPCKPPSDEMLDAAEKNYPDWEKLVAGDPTEMQSSAMGIPNPFGGTAGHGAVSYEEPSFDGEEFADGIEYGEPEQPKVKPKIGKNKKTGGLKIKLKR